MICRPADPDEHLETLEGFDIVCLGPVEWLVVRSVAEPTMLCLSRKNRVLFVEPFRSVAGLIRETRRQRRRPKFRWGLRQEGRGLWVYSPPPLGIPGTSRWWWPPEVNGWMLNRLLRPVMRTLGFARPLVWTFMPESAGAVRRLSGRLSIYDCIDQFEALIGSERVRRRVRAFEAELCRQVDIVFGITEGLVSARRALNPHTFEVNGAADLEHSRKALLETTRVPADLACLGRPVVGYLGSIDPWKIDVSLLTQIARARPQWQIALVGYVWFGFDPAVFRGFPNIRLLGPKRHDEFPGYLKGMDVCIMPYPLNEITRNGDSVKCYEYLAAGKPVVSTPVPSARRLSSVVRIADSAEAFISAIEASLPDSQDAVKRRLAASAPYTWERRVEEKSRLILRRLGEREDGEVPSVTGSSA
jgi:glycosyltransferase involved in cell wall biosynthesis